MAQISLHAITKVYYNSMSCFATDSPLKGLAYSVMDSPEKGPTRTMWFRQITKYVTKYDTKNDDNPHSTEQDTQTIPFLISRQAVPYWTHGGTCCPRVSTPKIRSLVDLSATCHDGLNHLHHSNHCSNHNIDLLTINSHLDGWKTITLSQRHKPNSTSQRMDRLVRLSRLHG
jgi:hypothetical protein